MTIYTIDQLEKAINVWRARQGSDGDAALCGPARILAEPYALAIVSRRLSIDSADLSDEQIAAINQALSPAGL